MNLSILLLSSIIIIGHSIVIIIGPLCKMHFTILPAKFKSSFGHLNVSRTGPIETHLKTGSQKEEKLATKKKISETWSWFLQVFRWRKEAIRERRAFNNCYYYHYYYMYLFSLQVNKILFLHNWCPTGFCLVLYLFAFQKSHCTCLLCRKFTRLAKKCLWFKKDPIQKNI